jgi:hypothetical protein
MQREDYKSLRSWDRGNSKKTAQKDSPINRILIILIMSFSPAILGADSCPADRLYSQISFIETSGLRLGIYAADGVRVISLRQKPAGREMIDDCRTGDDR